MHSPAARRLRYLDRLCIILVHTHSSTTYLIHVHLLFPLQEGATALHLASQDGHGNVVTILLESGSDIHAVAEVSALQIATFNCTPTSSVL